MGSGEFDGGSSVKWKVKPSKGDPGQPNPGGAAGRDKDPIGGTGYFVVLDNGTPVHTIGTAGHTITVLWGPESATPVVAKRAAKKKGGKK
jgi:hypothetical protein